MNKLIVDVDRSLISIIWHDSQHESYSISNLYKLGGEVMIFYGFHQNFRLFLLILRL